MQISITNILCALTLLTTSVRGKLLIYYPLNETSGTQAADFSGNSKHGRIFGGPQMTGGNGLRLDGVNDYVQLPNDVMRGLTSLTMSLDVLVRQEQATYYMIFALGNTGRNGDGNGYAFVTGTPFRAAITTTFYDYEARVGGANSLTRDQWSTVTFVVDGAAKTLALYRNSAYQGGHNNNIPIVTPGTIGSGSTTANYIGRSVYQADHYLSGSVRNFRLWDTALSAAEVANQANIGAGSLPSAVPPPSAVPSPSAVPVPDSPIPGAQTASQEVVNALGALTIANLDNVHDNLALPGTSNGLPVVWESSQPLIISNAGVVHQPTNGDTTVILTATVVKDDVQGSRSFIATVRMASQ